MRRVLSLLLVMGLVLAACTTTTEDTTTSSSTTASTVPATVTPTTAPTTTTSEAPATTTPPPETGQLAGLRPVEAFGDFPEIPLLGDDPAYAGPVHPDFARWGAVGRLPRLLAR
jgi:ABC-type Fe3+-hydroxamate transport system substrate-binding protein